MENKELQEAVSVLIQLCVNSFCEDNSLTLDEFKQQFDGGYLQNHGNECFVLIRHLSGQGEYFYRIEVAPDESVMEFIAEDSAAIQATHPKMVAQYYEQYPIQRVTH